MAENERLPALDNQQIAWNRYNYPPLIKIMHFVPSEVPRQKKFIVVSLFVIHLVIVTNCLLNFVDSCAQSALRVLYSFLFMLFFNPLILFVFYKGFTGICKSEGSLKPYFIFQAIAVVLEVVISIIGAFGFNGFARAHDLFEEGKGFSGALAVVVSSVFLSVALFSSYIFVRILREKKELTVGLA